MSENLKDEIDLQSYPVLSSDGAYVHFNNGIVRLVFFIDFVFPTRGEKESVRYDKHRRELIQEIRLSRQAASQVAGDLENLLLMRRRADEQLNVLPNPHEAHAEQFEQHFKVAFQKLYASTTPILQMLEQTNVEGQDKILALLEQFLEHKKPKFKEIVDEYPFRMRDDFGEESRRQSQ